MKRSIFVFFIGFISLALGLVIHTDESDKFFNSPRILFKKQHGFQPLLNYTITTPHDNYGCTFKASEGVPNTAYVIDLGTCSVTTKVKKAKDAGIKALIIASDNGGPAGADVRIGAIGIDFSDVIAVEVNLADGNTLKDDIKKAKKNSSMTLTVDIYDSDSNQWLDMYNSGGLVVWQIILTLLFVGIAAAAGFKSYMFYREGKTFKIVYFSLAAVIISAMFSILFVAVDPMTSRGVYDNLTQTVLHTLYLPPTFIATFMITFTLISTFKKSFTFQSDTIKKVTKGYIVVAFVAFGLDLIISIIRGSYLTNSPAINAITAILYIIFAITLIVGYIWAYRTIKKSMAPNSASTLSGNFKTVFQKFLNRSLWVFSVLYTFWIIMAIVSTWYFAFATSVTPTATAVIYFFLYFVVALINIYHVLLFELPKTNLSSSSADAKSKQSDGTELRLQKSASNANINDEV